MSKLSSIIGLSSNCEQIHNSPINTSKTKQLYSFPKSSRFSNTPKQYCDRAYYYLPSTRTPRSTSFGYGTKSDFTQSEQKFTPAPNIYQNILNQFDEKSHSKGFSFGLSRENLKEQGLFRQVRNPPPGPGTYQLRSTLSDLKYTLRPKTKNIQEKTTNKEAPGPGTYQNSPGISKNGKYFLSKFLSSGATTFNPTSSARFQGIPNDIKNFPAPNHYNPKSQITSDGVYFLSNFHSSQCRSFPKLQRAFFEIQKGGPGPGQYRVPSEFGYYEKI